MAEDSALRRRGPALAVIAASGAATVIRGDAAMHASVTMFIKSGDLPDGNGTYGNGQRCIFHGVDLGTG